MEELLKKRDKFEISKILIGMNFGFFCTLIFATVLSSIFVGIKNFEGIINFLRLGMSFAIGFSVGIYYKLPIMKVISLAICCQTVQMSEFIVTYSANGGYNFIPNFSFSSKRIDPLMVLFSLIVFCYFIRWSKLDFKSFNIIVFPVIGFAVGIVLSVTIAYVASIITATFTFIIISTTNIKSIYFLSGLIIGVLMGFCLTAPISSAAIAVSIGLSNQSLLMAMAGTAAQMVSFALMTALNTKNVPRTLVTLFGTSMFHFNRSMKNKYIWIAPILSSGIAGMLTAYIFYNGFKTEFSNVSSSIAGGMGTSVLIGQLIPLKESGWNTILCYNILITHFFIPIYITYIAYYLLARSGKIKSMEMMFAVGEKNE
jgi:uncharacterized membrane protein